MNRPRAVKYGVLVLGFAIAGLGLALMLQSALGMGPWGAFQVSIAEMTGLSVGRATQLVSLLLLGVAWLLGIKPTVACFINMIMVGFAFDFFAGIIPASNSLLMQFVFLGLGIISHAFGIALYLSTGLGSGPRESLMLGIHKRFKISIRLSRIFMDASILMVTLFSRGPIGIGTVFHTMGCGPFIQQFLQLLAQKPNRSRENKHLS